MRFFRSFHVSFHHAVHYYEAIDKKLARRLIEAVDRAQRDIIRFPKIGKQIKNGREYLLTGFPYSFCYQEDLDGEPVAVRLFHYKQNGPRISDGETSY